MIRTWINQPGLFGSWDCNQAGRRQQRIPDVRAENEYGGVKIRERCRMSGQHALVTAQIAEHLVCAMAKVKTDLGSGVQNVFLKVLLQLRTAGEARWKNIFPSTWACCRNWVIMFHRRQWTCKQDQQLNKRRNDGNGPSWNRARVSPQPGHPCRAEYNDSAKAWWLSQTCCVSKEQHGKRERPSAEVSARVMDKTLITSFAGGLFFFFCKKLSPGTTTERKTVGNIQMVNVNYWKRLKKWYWW